MWNTPDLWAILESLLGNTSSDRSKARLLFKSSRESGAGLNTFPIASCSLRMSDKTIRVVVGLRLGGPLSLPHTCNCHYCGGEVDCLGTHGLSCRWSECSLSHHAAINNIIFWALHSANVPSQEPRTLSV